MLATVTFHDPETPSGTGNANNSEVVYRRNVGVSSGPNILGILMSSLVLGLVSGTRLEKTQPFIALAEAVTEVMTILIEHIIRLLPLAMISLIASALASVDNLENGLIALSLFVASSVCFNAILSIIVFPLIYVIFVRRNLFVVYKAMYRPLITAFSTTSSLVTLPDLFKVCDQLGVEVHVVRTIAPFLTSFNANGSAAFVASAVCFTAQVAGFRLHVVQLIGIGFLAGFNVMALPAVPSASIITVFLIIRVFQIPEQAVSLLFIVEFINDRLRTVINVMSHATCILTVHFWCAKRQLLQKDPIPVTAVFKEDFEEKIVVQSNGDKPLLNGLDGQPLHLTVS
ncbi:unnamed protein product [Echinostoma caproni]|uniref:Amino acid transporter n=1 Tax=Echinostoma caproni TaxID=27848 RepID=A0A183AB34_9TREM|nr:unnamed protein product [Echinostoma caproni]